MNIDDKLRASFKASIEENLDALYGVACRLTGNPTKAEDLLSECVVKTWESYASLVDKTKFRPWAFRILHNCFISDYRKSKSRPVEVIESENDEDMFDLLDRMPDDFLIWWSNPEKAYVNKLLGEEITKAINGLPLKYRIVVTLINIEGLSYQEAADVIDVPIGTIRSRMKRGRTLLQKNLWDLAKDANLKLARAGQENESD